MEFPDHKVHFMDVGLDLNELNVQDPARRYLLGGSNDAGPFLRHIEELLAARLTYDTSKPDRERVELFQEGLKKLRGLATEDASSIRALAHLQSLEFYKRKVASIGLASREEVARRGLPWLWAAPGNVLTIGTADSVELLGDLLPDRADEVRVEGPRGKQMHSVSVSFLQAHALRFERLRAETLEVTGAGALSVLRSNHNHVNHLKVNGHQIGNLLVEADHIDIDTARVDALQVACRTLHISTAWVQGGSHIGLNSTDAEPFYANLYQFYTSSPGKIYGSGPKGGKIYLGEWGTQDCRDLLVYSEGPCEIEGRHPEYLSVNGLSVDPNRSASSRMGAWVWQVFGSPYVVNGPNGSLYFVVGNARVKLGS